MIVEVVRGRGAFDFPAAIAAAEYRMQRVGQAQACGEVAGLLFFAAVLSDKLSFS